MAKTQKESLFQLIKSLTKSEKRQFKLYVNRLGSNAGTKFIALFDLLDKMSVYDEQKISSSKIVKREQLSNVKSHLYKQILISLRLSISSTNKRLQLREQLDYVYILYYKGLYGQSLQMLQRVKTQAVKLDEKVTEFQAIEFEKAVQTQYLSKTSFDYVSEIASQSLQIATHNEITANLSSLSLLLYAKNVHYGYVKNDREYKEVTEFFESHIKEIDLENACFSESFWYYKSYLLYSILVQDLLSAYKFANKWVELFYLSPDMIELHPVFFYSRSSNICLKSCIY